MRVFVTGASGWIGSAVVPELLTAGHEVLGLARSDASADTVAALGAEVHRGTLEDRDSLRSGAAGADAVVQLGYHHDFSQMTEAAELDRRAIETFGDVLAESGGALVIASGLIGVATEQDRPDPAGHPRVANAQATLALADRGVRSAVGRFAPTVHGPGDYGFVAVLTEIAIRTGVAAYIDDGANHWPAVHRLDAAALVPLTVESAPAGAGVPAAAGAGVQLRVESPPAGSVLQPAAEPGVPTREIAESIGRSVGVPAESIPAADAA